MSHSPPLSACLVLRWEVMGDTVAKAKQPLVLVIAEVAWSLSTRLMSKGFLAQIICRIAAQFRS